MQWFWPSVSVCVLGEIPTWCGNGISVQRVWDVVSTSQPGRAQVRLQHQNEIITITCIFLNNIQWCNVHVQKYSDTPTMDWIQILYDEWIANTGSQMHYCVSYPELSPVMHLCLYAVISSSVVGTHPFNTLDFWRNLNEQVLNFWTAKLICW